MVATVAGVRIRRYRFVMMFATVGSTRTMMAVQTRMKVTVAVERGFLDRPVRAFMAMLTMVPAV